MRQYGGMRDDHAAASPPPDFPPVGDAECGQKLLQFLQRRLNLPPALLHRWIRTGQARLNGRRAKPFARLATGDQVRLPPFALALAAQAGAPGARTGDVPRPPAEPGVPAPQVSQALDTADAAAPSLTVLPPLPPLVGTAGAIWAFNKPAGLPVHPGSGHDDSLSTRLALHYASSAFTPTPAHRLDRDTSGILLVAASHAALREVQHWLRHRSLTKEYVAWVEGRWPWPDARRLRHWLRKGGPPGRERMRVYRQRDAEHTEHAVPPEGGAVEADCVVRPLRVSERESLLQIRLITGRTHQIRVQLATEGHPVVGDGKYGVAAQKPAQKQPRTQAAAPAAGRQTAGPQGIPLRLHALRAVLPDGQTFTCLPPWTGAHALDTLPEPLDSGAPAGCAPQPDSSSSGTGI